MYRLLGLLWVLGFVSSPLLAQNCEETRAAFDIGSSTTKMKVYKYDSCNDKIIHQIKKLGRLNCKQDRKVAYKGDLKNSDTIQNKTVAEGVRSILELKKIARDCGATKFSGVATSAFRQAKNGKDVALTLEKRTGLSISIISQEEEATLGFNGAISKVNDIPESAQVCVWDIGGSSMQIVCVLGDKKKVYLGHLASVPFKNYLIENKLEEDLRELTTPNPITSFDYSHGLSKTAKEALKIQEALGDLLENSIVLGIGGVHYYSVSRVIKKEEFSANDISDEISSKLGKTDADLGGGKYVDSSISNLILVEGLMRKLNISRVKALSVNLTEGLVSSPKYWK